MSCLAIIHPIMLEWFLYYFLHEFLKHGVNIHSNTSDIFIRKDSEVKKKKLMIAAFIAFSHHEVLNDKHNMIPTKVNARWQ